MFSLTHAPDRSTDSSAAATSSHSVMVISVPSPMTGANSSPYA